MAAKFNPLAPGAGYAPPALTGRTRETRLLADALDLLAGPRAAGGERLASSPFPPIKIIGPCGAGKTALLSWLKNQAKNRQIRVVHCAQLEQPEAKDDPMQRLLARMLDAMRFFDRVSAKLFSAVDFSMASDKPMLAYESMAKALVAKRPLLVVLDEAQHFDPAHLAMVIQASQELIIDGRPLAVALAGAPGLDSRLANSEAAFTVLGKETYISTLSEAATRAALREPFEREGVAVPADALDAMTELTDCYPFFIQVVGAEVWDAMAEAGRRDIDAGVVKQIEEKARKRSMSLYEKAYEQMRANRLLPHARQVMELLEKNGGKMGVNLLIDALADAVPDMDDVQAQQICRQLQEDGFIWNVDGETKPGIPSFFSYFKEQQKK